MAIRHVVTRGFSNGTFTGSIGLVVTAGFTSAVLIAYPPAGVVAGMVYHGGFQAGQQWGG